MFLFFVCFYCVCFLKSMTHWTEQNSTAAFIWHQKLLQGNHILQCRTKWMYIDWLNHPHSAYPDWFSELRMVLQGTCLIRAAFLYFRQLAERGLLGRDMSIHRALNTPRQIATHKSFNNLCCIQREMIVLQHLALEFSWRVKISYVKMCLSRQELAEGQSWF